MVRVQKKMHAAEPQVQADHPAFPARWFYGLYAISPVTSLVATVIGETRKRLHDLSACIGAPGPRDFAVRTHAARRARTAPGDVRPSHPAPNVRDDREPPLLWVRDTPRKPLIWGRRKAQYFFEHDWTTQIALNPLTKSVFTRTSFSALKVRPLR
jgi:hypothetical protein